MAVPGSVWVQGTQLRFTSQSGTNYAYEGVYVSAPSGAKPGSLWVEGADLLYIDSAGSKRRVTNYTATSIPSAVQGSLWISGNYMYWINQSGNKTYGHADVGYQNDSYNDGLYYNYSNYGGVHTDVPATAGYWNHVNQYSNATPYANHSDTYHNDHADAATSHNDTGYNNVVYNNSGSSHQNSTSQHGDYTNYNDTHNNVTHSDSAHGDGPFAV